jgi:hypothetical protein
VCEAWCVFAAFRARAGDSVPAEGRVDGVGAVGGADDDHVAALGDAVHEGEQRAHLVVCLCVRAFVRSCACALACVRVCVCAWSSCVWLFGIVCAWARLSSGDSDRWKMALRTNERCGG